MLDALMDQEGFRPYFKGFISADEMGVYTPSPKVYRHVAQRFGRPIGEVRLVSSNPFDDIGAEAAGMREAWLIAPAASSTRGDCARGCSWIP